MSQQLNIRNIFPKHRQNLYKADGYGYQDSIFYFHSKKKVLKFDGERYPQLHQREFVNAYSTFKSVYSIDISKSKLHEKQIPNPSDFPLIDNAEFRQKLHEEKIEYSTRFNNRFYRGHSQTWTEIFTAIYGKFKRIPDIVAWPKNHKEVVKIVKLANECNVAIIPFGGGSNVTGSVKCPDSETRTILSLDLTQMDKILWIDEKSMLACFEAGISLKVLEEILDLKGLTIGHFDFNEFGTLGGLVAKNSLENKKFIGGFKVVTSVGVLEQTSEEKKDFILENLMIGSEGTLGVITEVVVKIHRQIKYKKISTSIAFPDLSAGINFLRVCSQNESRSMKFDLLCNSHVQTGLVLEEASSLKAKFVSSIRSLIYGSLSNYDINKFIVVSFIIEGDQDDIDKKFIMMKEVAGRFNGYLVGDSDKLNFKVMEKYSMYLRDLFINLETLAANFDVSVVWSKLEHCIENIKSRYLEELKKRNVKGFIIYRLNNIYREGANVKFTYGINKCDDQLNELHFMTNFLKDILQAGSEKSFDNVQAANSEEKSFDKFKIHAEERKLALNALKKKINNIIKADIDPKNIFCVQNLQNEEKFVAKL